MTIVPFMREEEVFRFDGEGIRVVLTAYRGGGARPRPVDDRRWRRAMRLLDRLGGERCLSAMDMRAEAAFGRGDMPTCLAWRDLMAAVHAALSDRRGEVPPDRPAAGGPDPADPRRPRLAVA